MLFLIWLILAHAGLTSLVLGVRGRILDNHRVCRVCRYDLSGRPDSSTRCTECGADLNLPNAIRIGNRQRRPALVAVGVVLLLASLTLLSWTEIDRWQLFNVTRWKPVFLLGADLENATRQFSALGELRRRLDVGQITENDMHLATDRLLALQKSASPVWSAMTADQLVELRRTYGSRAISTDQWNTYIYQSAPLEAKYRQRRRVSTAATIRVAGVGWRGGSTFGERAFSAKMDATFVTADGLKKLSTGSPLFERVGDVDLVDKFTASNDWKFKDASKVFRVEDWHPPLGPAKATLKVHVSGTYAGLPFDVIYPFELNYDIVPDETELVKASKDLATPEELTKLFHAEPLKKRDTDFEEGTLVVKSLPCDVAFVVWIAQGNQRWLEGAILIPKDSGETTYHWYSMLAFVSREEQPKLGSAQMVFQTRPEIAVTTPSVETVFDGELRIPIEIVEAPPQ